MRVLGGFRPPKTEGRGRSGTCSGCVSAKETNASNQTRLGGAGGGGWIWRRHEEDHAVVLLLNVLALLFLFQQEIQQLDLDSFHHRHRSSFMSMLQGASIPWIFVNNNRCRPRRPTR